MIGELLRKGIIGLFVLAFVSNAIPYMSVPYLVVVAPLFAMMQSTELTMSIIMLALGASLGKLVVYGVSRGVGGIKRVRLGLKGLAVAVNTYKKATFLAIFLAAATPMPDDVIYIPVGISKYNVLFFFIATFLGKFIITSLTAIYGITAARVLEEIGVPEWIYIPSTIVLTILIILIINKINWVEVGKVYEEGGLSKALIYIIKSFIKIILSIRL
jgi:membrane protein DedA with SNARE-associated domain